MTRIWYKHRQIFLKGKNTNTPLDMISTGESFAQTANGSDSVRSLGEEVLEEASLRCVTVVRLLFTSHVTVTLSITVGDEILPKFYPE